MIRRLIPLGLALSNAVASRLQPGAETIRQDASDLTGRQVPNFPSSFTWSSTDALVAPKNDGRNIAGIKDPSVVLVNGTYHVFASTAQESGYSLVYFNFADFARAGSATFHYLDGTAIGQGYRAAPQVFFFAPHGLWYLVFQNGNAAYSTNRDIGDPAGWSAPRNFYAGGQPAIVAENIGDGYWVDMWVICDAARCFLFSSDDNGHLYRSETALADFPGGMRDPVIALADERNALFEAANVYRVGDGLYLLLVEAIGTDGHRYFRSWTSDRIDGAWRALAATEANPFMGSSNVVFASGLAWTKSISHGEIVRTELDQQLTIDPCGMRYMYQGLSPSAGGSYNSLPWRLGLLTQTNSSC
jgi:hypothetical protein